MDNRIDWIKHEIYPLREQLVQHKLYSSLKSIDDLNAFMSHHVFAVWDFMSLLKSLQNQLTCTSIPWFPKGDAETRFLINEIVIGEECDVDQNGKRMSHFELYLKAMHESGADSTNINNLIRQIHQGNNIYKALELCNTPTGISKFVKNTFDTIETKELHVQAAVFTFGREDLIPGMFLSFVKEVGKNDATKLDTFLYYLERHIEVDGGSHSHLANKMTEQLCGHNPQKWDEALYAIKEALSARIALWDYILTQIK